MEPLVLPDQVWNEPQTQAALRARHVGYLFQLAQKYAGASQTRIANVTGMAQSEVSRIRAGDRQVTAIDVLERVAQGFVMPDRARVVLGLAPQSWTGASEGGGSAADEPKARPCRCTARRETPWAAQHLPASLTEPVGRQAEIAGICRRRSPSPSAARRRSRTWGSWCGPGGW